MVFFPMLQAHPFPDGLQQDFPGLNEVESPVEQAVLSSGRSSHSLMPLLCSMKYLWFGIDVSPSQFAIAGVRAKVLS